MKHIAIIDGNGLGFAVYASFKKTGLLCSSAGIPTTVTFGILNTLNTMQESNNAPRCDNVVVCWDMAGGSAYRKGIFPKYKAGRVYDSDIKDYYNELTAAQDTFKILGLNQIKMHGIEADDIIGYLANRFSAMDYKVTIVSSDKDFYQLLNRNIQQYRNTMSEFVLHTDVQNSDFGVDPAFVSKLIALTGQKSDNIPGPCDLGPDGVMVPCGIGIVKARNLLFYQNKYGKMNKVFHNLRRGVYPTGKSGINADQADRFLQKREQIYMSWKLARIRVRDEDYTTEQLSNLTALIEDIRCGQARSAEAVQQYIDMLEIKAFNPLKVLRKCGVKFDNREKDLSFDAHKMGVIT